jgi:hypothetical protein
LIAEYCVLILASLTYVKQQTLLTATTAMRLGEVCKRGIVFWRYRSPFAGICCPRVEQVRERHTKDRFEGIIVVQELHVVCPYGLRKFSCKYREEEKRKKKEEENKRRREGEKERRREGEKERRREEGA